MLTTLDGATVPIPATSSALSSATAAAQTSWGYDPQNVTGAASDTGPGTGGDNGTQIAPLLTWAEFMRRTQDVTPTASGLIVVRFFSVDTTFQGYPFVWRRITSKQFLWVVADRSHLTNANAATFLVATGNIDALTSENIATQTPRKLTSNALNMPSFYSYATVNGSLSFRDVQSGAVAFSPTGTRLETAHVTRLTAPYVRTTPTAGSHYPRPTSATEFVVGHTLNIERIASIGGFDFSALTLESDGPSWSTDAYAQDDSFRVLVEGFKLGATVDSSGNVTAQVQEKPSTRGGQGMIGYFNCIVGEFIPGPARTAWWSCIIHGCGGISVGDGFHQFYGCLFDFSPVFGGSGFYTLNDCYFDTVSLYATGNAHVSFLSHAGGATLGGASAFFDTVDFSGWAIQLDAGARMSIAGNVYGNRNPLGLRLREGARINEGKSGPLKVIHGLNNLVCTTNSCDNDGTTTAPNVGAAGATVAALSNGVNVNTFFGSGVLNVSSTTGYPTAGFLSIPALGVVIQYTGTTASTFTGCTTLFSGAGVLATGQAVNGAFAYGVNATTGAGVVELTA